jgi:adenine-specific DNA-methyltransferase
VEKVTLIKDISIETPHRAHIEILYDLSFDKLQSDFEFRNFVELHNAWQKTLDSSELNKRFYKELANWYFWAVDNVEFPDDVDKDREKRNSTNVIRMLTRLIFVWFLKEKDNLIPDELFNKKKLDKILDYKDKTGSTYYKAIMQNLFFATLNTEMNKDVPDNRTFVKRQFGIQEFYRYERFFKNKEAALKLFENIPFLNGGLFENLDKNVGEPTEQRIDCFSNNRKNEERLSVPDYLFFETEKQYDKLNKVYDTSGKKYVVRGLIEILNKYKFTIHENTPIEEEIALDPELLGKVFENLLASYNEETKTTARKLTGSFYTPREVVNYMVEESLIAYLKNVLIEKGSKEVEEKLRDLFSYNENEPQFTENEKRILIEAIDNCKIVDPACGSGAFPMGILHKMVFILGKLDPHNERWMQRQIDKVYDIPDTTLHDNLKAEIEKAFKENYNDYGRKLYLIENCIYGVDIQPIAVQIAKLRFFISLIVDQKVDRKTKNLGIRPLPNLETKFVAGNTLIGIERPKQMTLRNAAIDDKEKQLRDVRERHFNARTPAAKKKYRQRDKELRKELADLLERDGFKPEATRLMASWDPYDQNKFAAFFDSEWMFGLQKGFDVVIGNPPYISIANLPTNVSTELSKQNYETFSKGADLYCLFYERGLKLLTANGFLTYISSNRFCFTNYGDGLREYLSKRNILELINFNEIEVFESANVGSIVAVIQNTKPDSNPILIYEVKSVDAISRIHLEKKYSSKDYYQKDQWSFDENNIQKLKKTIELKGVGFAKRKDILINRGVTTGANGIFIIPTSVKEKLCAEHPSSKELIKPVLRGRDIKRFYLQWTGDWIIFTRRGTNIEKYPAIKKYLSQFRNELEPGVGRKQGNYKWFEIQDNTAFYPQFEKRKLIWTRLSNINAFAISTEKEFSLDSTSFAVGDNLEYLSAILNSKITFFYFKLGSVIWGKDGIKWFGKYFDNIPIPQISKDEQRPFENLVNYILQAHELLNGESNREIITKQFEEVIDGMVNELFFENSIKEANASIIDLVKKQITDISSVRGKEEKQKLIEKVYKKISEPNSEIRNRIIKQNIAVDEIKLINQNLNLQAGDYSEDIDSEF